MSEQISHPIEFTIREYEILEKAFIARERKLKADAVRCHKSYDGKATTLAKAHDYIIEACELNDLLSKIAQEFS
jgi:hypothetical protein